jgi:hypothetical protein
VVECEGYGAKRIAFRSAKKKNTNNNRSSENAHLTLTTVTGASPFSSTSSEISSPSPYSPLSNPAILTSTPIDYHQRTLLKHFLSDFAPLRSALQQTHGSTPRPQMRHNVNAFQHYEEAVRLLRQSVDRFEQGKEVQSSSYRNSTDDMYACLAAAYLLTWFEVCA